MSYYSNFLQYGGAQTQIAPSIIEAQQPFGSPINQHFWEWFSGDALDSIWSTYGTGTVSMADAIDEGLDLTRSASEFGIGFGGSSSIDHYSSSGVESIFVFRRVGVGASVASWAGLKNSSTSTNDDYIVAYDNDSNTFVQMLTSNAATTTTVNTTISADATWHWYKLKLQSSFATIHIDSAFEGVITTNLPNSNLNPVIACSNTASSRTRIRYFEVFNT